NKTIFNPGFEEISLELLLSKLKQHKVSLITGGVIPKDFIKKANKENIEVLDFFEQESVSVLNAIPTAEGAIQTAMEESDKTIFGSNSLILGYGRCGKILANTLKGIGSNVTVTYRKEQDYSYINAYGLNSIHLNKLNEHINKFDFIFNTIPHCILNKNELEKINENAIIIDLAQAPGGVDYTTARELNINAIYCPGLPGRVAPFTAGKILKDALLNYCNSKEM
ncbi:MAG: dipicolinate synthase subunit DpsA, partial [Eubacteriales bacterium]|nr:dipicolinate synthase subunit DpsA [Eubacteriales bacterium]